MHDKVGQKEKSLMIDKNQIKMAKTMLDSPMVKAQIEAMARMKESGMIEQMERMKEIYKDLNPLFPSFSLQDKEKIIESYEVAENPDTEPEKREKAVKI